MTLSDDFVNRYADKTPPWGFDGLGYIVYKRTYARLLDADTGATEEWYQTIRRVIDGAAAIDARLSEAEEERLFDYMFNLKATVGGRMLWQLGTDNIERLGGDSLVNCWGVTITKPEDYSWMFDRLMLGGGVGFSVLSAPESLGVVRQGVVIHENVNDADYIVPDKREGWCEALLRAINTYLGDESDPQRVIYNTALVREAGALIKTFGGVASGPEILIHGISLITSILDGAVGRHLTTVEAGDIGNIIGHIVVSGNVRRAAELMLGDALDEDFLMAKRWDLGSVPAYRGMSNNSVIANDIESLPQLFWDGYEGNGEPYGLINMEAARAFGRTSEARMDETITVTNPCAEIPLANRESCNLSEIFLPNVTSYSELADISKILYKIQKAVAALPYLDAESSAITSQNMRLGLGVTGIFQASDTQLNWLDRAYEELREFDASWSELRGWPESVRLTTVKPSGTLSLLGGVTPGACPGYSKYHIRRVGMPADSALFQYLLEAGYGWESLRQLDGTYDTKSVVVEFPCKFPDGTGVSEDVSALDQLTTQSFLQRVWADNAISITVYYSPEELPEIKQYLKENWHNMKSVSFLLHDDHGFEQAPLEEITEDMYHEMLSKVELNNTFTGEGLIDLDDADCASGACPVR